MLRPRFAVILPAAGQSKRFGGAVKKVHLSLQDIPVWEHSARLFVQRADVVQVLLVTANDFRVNDPLLREAVQLVPGGAERWESVANALAALRPEAEFVAIHDAARPCLTPALIDDVFARALVTGAAMLAVPVTDTLKRGDAAGQIVETVPRQGLWLAQTPQVFRRDWLEGAYAHKTSLGEAITDDAQLVAAAGHAVHLVPGSTTNVKITSPADLVLAEAILRARSPVLGERGWGEGGA